MKEVLGCRADRKQPSAKATLILGGEREARRAQDRGLLGRRGLSGDWLGLRNGEQSVLQPVRLEAGPAGLGATPSPPSD